MLVFGDPWRLAHSTKDGGRQRTLSDLFLLLGPILLNAFLPIHSLADPLPGLLRSMVMDGIRIVLARTVLLSFMLFIEVSFLRFRGHIFKNSLILRS